VRQVHGGAFRDDATEDATERRADADPSDVALRALTSNRSLTIDQNPDRTAPDVARWKNTRPRSAG
jgi:hypothetical protein